MTKTENNLMEKVVSLAKRRGFIYPGSEIYGGFAGTFDYGPLGVALKNNIKNLWWKKFVLARDDMYGMDAAILMNQNVWKASGHVSGFADPLTDESGKTRQFNMMFQTRVGVGDDESSVSYLRPETAQGMFVNFKNVVDSFHPRLPFGLAQIGKAFRNEIAPRDFLFRLRELEQMEIEYFVEEKKWKDSFEEFRKLMWQWVEEIGLNPKHVSELEVPDADRAHYSKRTIDFEFEYPFGRKELYGLAYRTDFDLKAHSKSSNTDFVMVHEETKEKIVPHCIEPSFGVDRTVLAILLDAYTEDELGGEKRAYLKFSPKVAPVKAAVFPLLKNKPDLIKKAEEVYRALKKEIPEVVFDDNGNIGKRYRRQDEIGTPHCITIDFQTLEDDTVTVRDRDSGKQDRININNLTKKILEVN